MAPTIPGPAHFRPTQNEIFGQNGAMLDFSAKPTLVGDRATLRPVRTADVPGLLDLVTDPEGRRLTGTQAAVSEPALRTWYATRAGRAERLDLAVVERATGEYAGEVVLNELDTANRACSFRIALRAAHRDRGLGTDASRLVLEHAFQTVGLHRISLQVYAFNPRARAVYERVGFRAEGVLRDALLWDGDFVDAITMSVLAPEWATHRGHPAELSTPDTAHRL
jgi:RimJ/RimL family protein N-acetyltransferase